MIQVTIPKNETNWHFYSRTPGTYEEWHLGPELLLWFRHRGMFYPPITYNDKWIKVCFSDQDKEAAMLFKLTWG